MCDSPQFTQFHGRQLPAEGCGGMGVGVGGDNLCFKRQHRKITCCWISACFSCLPPLIFCSLIMKNGGKKNTLKSTRGFLQPCYHEDSKNRRTDACSYCIFVSAIRKYLNFQRLLIISLLIAIRICEAFPVFFSK